MTSQLMDDPELSSDEEEPGATSSDSEPLPEGNSEWGDYVCQICLKAFPDKQTMSEHSLRHMGKKFHFCDVCGKGFLERCKLRRHEKVHKRMEYNPLSKPATKGVATAGRNPKNRSKTPTSNRKRTNCKKKGKSKFGSQESLGDMNGTSCAYFAVPSHDLRMCNVCGKGFDQAEDLETHSASHPPTVLKECEWCDDLFSTRLTLQKHRHVHQKSELYLCTLCHEVFGHLQQFRRHLMTHTDERPFVCAICAKGFREKMKLKRHEFTHQDVKPHACAVCDRSFCTPYELRNHSERHAVGEAPEDRPSQ